ncbi:MAG TPA: hypothetical protein VG501_10625, partial [Rhizomicrobium sp.]|nr:hypothetical protein [Rhizomicrobium sp.]
MRLRAGLMNGGALWAALVFSGAQAGAATLNPMLGGTITYTGTAGTLGSGYVIDNTAVATTTVTGVTIVQTEHNPALLIDNIADQSFNVNFSGAATSISGVADALNVGSFNVGGSVSLDTTGTTTGNSFTSTNDFGVDVETDTMGATNATATLGADTITSTNGTGIRASSGSGNTTLTTAATVTGGLNGIEAAASGTLLVTVSGTVTGSQAHTIDIGGFTEQVGSVFMRNHGTSTLTLQTGAKLVGDAIGFNDGSSYYQKATYNLVLQGQGSTANNFVNFNNVDVQNGQGGSWTLNGTSSFSGTLTVDAGGQLVQNADGGNTFANAVNNGKLVVNAATLEATGTLTNNGTIFIGSGGEVSAGHIVQNLGSINLGKNAVIDPAAIDILGGSFGGDGTV